MTPDLELPTDTRQRMTWMPPAQAAAHRLLTRLHARHLAALYSVRSAPRGRRTLSRQRAADHAPSAVEQVWVNPAAASAATGVLNLHLHFTALRLSHRRQPPTGAGSNAIAGPRFRADPAKVHASPMALLPARAEPQAQFAHATAPVQRGNATRVHEARSHETLALPRTHDPAVLARAAAPANGFAAREESDLSSSDRAQERDATPAVALTTPRAPVPRARGSEEWPQHGPPLTFRHAGIAPEIPAQPLAPAAASTLVETLFDQAQRQRGLGELGLRVLPAEEAAAGRMAPAATFRIAERRVASASQWSRDELQLVAERVAGVLRECERRERERLGNC